MRIIESVIVTGGTGNIGSAIVDELVKHNYKVKVLCQSPESADKAKKMGAIAIPGSLSEPAKWLAELDNCDALVHTACTFDENMGAIDISLMQAIAKRALKRRNSLILLYTAGCWTYGSHEDVITELTPKQSVRDFQWMLDSIAFMRSKTNIDLRIVSPTNVVSSDDRNLPPILMWEIERCGQPTLPRHDSQTWSLIERRNLAELYRLVLEKGQKGEEYIASAEHTAPLKRLLSLVSSKPVRAEALDEWLETYGTWTEGYGLTQVFSSNKAISDLGWKPKTFIS